MEQFLLQASRRTPRGKGGARQARREGHIPAVVYGRGQIALPIAVSAASLRRLLQHAPGGTLMVNLRIGEGAEAQEQFAVIKEVQREPVSGEVLHVDFQAIPSTERLTFTVPIEIVGEAPGVLEDGVLQIMLPNVAVECFPINVPEHLQADVSGLHLHETLSAGDLTLPDGVTLLTDPDKPVVVISASKGVEAPAGEEETAESWTEETSES